MKFLFSIILLTNLLFAGAQLSPSAFKNLKKIQELNKDKQYNTALKMIKKALSGDLKKADRAYYLQSQGYIYISKNKHKLALKSFEQMNKLKVMGPEITQNIMYTMGQLYLSLKEYQKSINMIDRWIKEVKKVRPEAYVFQSQAYTLLKKYNQAIAKANKAIALQKKLKKEVPASWYEILFSNYYQVKNYKKAISVLHVLIELKPKKKDYWVYISQLYSLNKQPLKGVSLFEQAYNLNVLKDKDLVQFGQFLLQNEIYFKGATLLDKHLKKKDIEYNKDNLKLIVDGFFNAKEYQKVLKTLDKLISLTKNHKYILQKARILSMIHNYPDAIKYYQRALKDKKIKDYYPAHLELSYLYYETKNIDKCKRALKVALKDKKTKKNAKSFLEQIEKI